MPFKKGQVGNPKGRPRGSKNVKTLFLQELEKDTPALAAALRRLALEEGDPTALALWVNRIEPALKSVARPVRIHLDTEASLADQAKSIRLAVANGELDVDSGKAMLEMLLVEQGFANLDAFLEEMKKLKNGGSNTLPVAGGVQHDPSME